VVTGNVVTVRDAVTGELLGPSMSEERRIAAAAFSPDSQRVIIATEDGGARILEIATGRLIRSSPEAGTAQERRRFLALSSGGRRLLTEGEGTLSVLETASGEGICVPLDHHEVSQAAFSSDGRYVVTASTRDSSAWIWDAHDGRRIGPRLRSA